MTVTDEVRGKDNGLAAVPPHPLDFLRDNFAMHQEIKNLSLKALSYGVFGVSTGIFVLSATLLTNSKNVPICPASAIALIAAWVFAALSLASAGLFYFAFYRVSLLNQLFMIKESRSKPDPKTWTMDYSDRPEVRYWKELVNIGVKVSAGCLAAAMLALIIYAAEYALAIQKINQHNQIYLQYTNGMPSWR